MYNFQSDDFANVSQYHYDKSKVFSPHPKSDILNNIKKFFYCMPKDYYFPFYKYNYDYYKSKKINDTVGILYSNIDNAIIKNNTLPHPDNKKTYLGIVSNMNTKTLNYLCNNEHMRLGQHNKKAYVKIFNKLFDLFISDKKNNDYELISLFDDCKYKIIPILKHFKSSYSNMNIDEIRKYILNLLLLLEKYSFDIEKKTFIIIPSNHEKYPFPYNLEDRINAIKYKIESFKFSNNRIKFNIEQYDNKYIIVMENDKIYERCKYELNEYLIKMECVKISENNYELNKSIDDDELIHELDITFEIGLYN